MVKLLLVIISISINSIAIGQGKFYTKNGNVSFFSKTQLENIDAFNRSVTCVLDTKTGNIQFSVLMKGFEFKKALMQEHFNEDYVESDKYPKAEFKGTILNSSSIDYSKTAVHQVKVKGHMTMHGQTNEIETDGIVSVKDGKISLVSEFQVYIADYKISVAAFAKNKVSKMIQVKVSCMLDPLK